MSRIGKLPVEIPAGVTITVDGDLVKVTGPKGNLEEKLLPHVTVTIEDGVLNVARNSDEKISRSQHGLMRSLINNMVVGVTKGFEKKLEVNGVGFKVALQGSTLVLNLGFSHPVEFTAPEGITLGVDKLNISVQGISKQQVGQVAADIRAFKKPEPYKGKGIKYEGEHIIRKAGKTGAK
ncbi:MAG TPA: 50S ribosomal protein L6 [Candidatus Saccharibacteria bacterium]|jgi:large subunit ribosomal protein L6|nr:large subunit ribosomal protein [Patescibacteria group bacterium]HMS31068.1 50S ribosomal protein L6 [Candidatus Saccharibacteria bacterium]